MHFLNNKDLMRKYFNGKINFYTNSCAKSFYDLPDKKS